MNARQITSPEHTQATTEIVAGLLDANGFDADAPVTVDDETGKTLIRDPQGTVYELSLRPVGLDHGSEAWWGRFGENDSVAGGGTEPGGLDWI
jgi:hypothetical protein